MSVSERSKIKVEKNIKTMVIWDIGQRKSDSLAFVLGFLGKDELSKLDAVLVSPSKEASDRFIKRVKELAKNIEPIKCLQKQFKQPFIEAIKKRGLKWLKQC